MAADRRERPHAVRGARADPLDRRRTSCTSATSRTSSCSGRSSASGSGSSGRASARDLSAVARRSCWRRWSRSSSSSRSRSTQGGDQILYFTAVSRPGRRAWLVLPLIFVAVAAVMACSGRASAGCFASFQPLTAYRLDLSAALVGIVAFTVLSFLARRRSVWGAGRRAVLLAVHCRRVAALSGRRPLLVAGRAARRRVAERRRLSWSPYYKITASRRDHRRAPTSPSTASRTRRSAASSTAPLAEPLYDLALRAHRRRPARQRADRRRRHRQRRGGRARAGRASTSTRSRSTRGIAAHRARSCTPTTRTRTRGCTCTSTTAARSCERTGTKYDLDPVRAARTR